MKKLVSFLLTVCTSFSVSVMLAACGDKTDDKVTTTVTEEEWNAAFALNNFTVSGFLTENAEQESVTFKATDVAYYSENNGYTAWCIEKDDGWYMYSNGSTEGQLVNGFTSAVSTVLMSFHLPEYASFTYDETAKAYICVNADYPEAYYQFNVYFENDVVVKFESRDNADTVMYSFNFKDYGTTVLNVPENLQ